MRRLLIAGLLAGFSIPIVLVDDFLPKASIHAMVEQLSSQ